MPWCTSTHDKSSIDAARKFRNARYISPDPMNPHKGVLAAAAVRDLADCIENYVMKNDASEKA
jgi:hypothetical protein